MKKAVLLCLSLWSGIALYGQPGPGVRIHKSMEALLPETLSQVQMEWVMLDADTLLDLVVVGVANDGLVRIMSFQNKMTSLEWKFTQTTELQQAYLQLSDVDRDNKVDVLLSGKAQLQNDGLFFFKNKGDFTFSVIKLTDRKTAFRVADFTNDGKLDILLFDSLANASLTVIENDSIGFKIRFDSAQLAIRDVAVADFNNDGRLDFAISGKDKLLAPYVAVFTATEKARFIVQSLTSPVYGLLTAVDKNSDGWMDLIGTGKSSNGQQEQLWLGDQKGSLSLALSHVTAASESLFAGDMNADGVTDIVTVQPNAGPQPIIRIDMDPTVQIISVPGLLIQREGDADGDGDLDIAFIADSIAQQWIKVLRVEASDTNRKPSKPSGLYAISTDHKTFITWDSSSDDHTPPLALTHDVWLGSSGTLLAPNFQLSTAARMVVAHGNAGATQAKMITNLKDGRYAYLVQTVDNAYRGSGFAKGNVLLCFDLAHENVNACKDQQVELTSAGEAYWFSTRTGFLKKSSLLTFTASVSDTIYSFVPQGSDCGKNKVYRIHVFNALSQTQVLYACEGASLKLTIDPGWQHVQWDTNPVVTNVDNLIVTLDANKTIIATATGGAGCVFKKTFNLFISKPKLNLNGVSFRIKKGSPVQLEATGTFAQYSWSPVTGLSNPHSSSPLADPVETTLYKVTATDSIGCVVVAEVQVQVEFTAFVPNLFTPNGDDKNDSFLVYGLGDTSGFRFQVFNRDGSVVFETSDPSAASHTGWNGYVNGTRQPPGVYYWKVEGSTNTGDPLMLNGKKTGSVLLIH